MGSPLVSIALCTYNGERFLSKQLSSILSQTHQNIELIIVDDCSTDCTVEIIKEFQNDDSRIKLFVNESNIGFNNNFVKAIGLCSGSFISISDQDDIWLKHKVETLLKCISDYDMVYANSAFIDTTDHLTGNYIINLNRNHLKYQHYKNILLENFVTGHNVLMRKQALMQLFPFPENSFYDWWMGFVMLYENKLVYCDEILTYYRIHDASVMNVIQSNIKSSSKLNQINTAYTILQQLKDFGNYKNLHQKDRQFIKKLEASFKEKVSSYYSLSLYKILWANFKCLFPRYSGSFIAKTLFLNRYCRGIKLLHLVSR